MDKGAMVTLTCTFAMGWTECLLDRIDVHLFFPFVGMVLLFTSREGLTKGLLVPHPLSSPRFRSQSV